MSESDKDRDDKGRKGEEGKAAGPGGPEGQARAGGKPGVAPGPGSTGKARKGPSVVGRVILTVVAVVGLCGGGLWLVDSIAYTSTDDAAIDGNHVNVASKILGRIKKLEVAEGDRVAAGQIVVHLDDSDLLAQQLSSSAALATARENLSLSKINLDKTQDDFNRSELLFRSQATTKENFDHAAKALETAKAQYSIAKAQVDAAEAQLGVLSVSLLNTKIASPLAGTVQKESFMAGDVVQPGQTIISVNNLDDLWVTANFEETKIAKITLGAKVLVSVDALGGRTLEGRVQMIGAGIVAPPFSIGDFSKTTQRVPVKIRFVVPIAGLTILPGMSVEVKVRTPARLPAFLERLHR